MEGLPSASKMVATISRASPLKVPAGLVETCAPSPMVAWMLFDGGRRLVVRERRATIRRCCVRRAADDGDIAVDGGHQRDARAVGIVRGTGGGLGEIRLGVGRAAAGEERDGDLRIAGPARADRDHRGAAREPDRDRDGRNSALSLPGLSVNSAVCVYEAPLPTNT